MQLSEVYLRILVINAEYAAYKSPKFTQPMARAREGILANIVEKCYKLAQDVDISFRGNHRKSSSISSDRSSRSGAGCNHESVAPTPSRSSMIKEFSEGLASLGRRRSAQENPDNQGKQTRPSRQRKGNEVEGKLYTRLLCDSVFN